MVYLERGEALLCEAECGHEVVGRLGDDGSPSMDRTPPQCHSVISSVRSLFAGLQSGIFVALAPPTYHSELTLGA